MSRARVRVTLPEYWKLWYHKHHGCTFRGTRGDWILLNKLKAQYGGEELAWFIRMFPKLCAGDAFCKNKAFNVKALKERTDFLHREFVRHFEREGRKEMIATGEQLSLLSDSPQVREMVDRVGKEMP